MNVQLDTTVNTKLQQEIQERMVDKNLSVAGLEKKAGLRMSAVRNILRGQSKRPSAEILQAIARTLECSITDLIGEEQAKVDSPSIANNKSIRFNNPQLLANATEMVTKLLSSRQHNLTLQQVLHLVEQIYSYSAQNSQSNDIDTKFANWVVEQAV